MIALFLVLIGLLLFPVQIFGQSATTTSPNSGCPGGDAIYQDIAIVYEATFSADNTSLEFSQQIATAIYSSLFVGPAFQYFDSNGNRVTQITALPFPNTNKYNLFGLLYNYGLIQNVTDFKKLLDNQLSYTGVSYVGHPTNSKISDGLSYLNSYLQRGRRGTPIGNTVVIVSKSDMDVSQAGVYVTDLKSQNAKIMTIGVGNGSLSGLSSLSSGVGYSFLLPDITDNGAVSNLAQQISTILLNDCSTTLVPGNYSTTTGPATSPTTPSTSTTSSSTITSTTLSTSTSTTPSTVSSTTESTTSTTTPQSTTSTSTTLSTSTSTSTTSIPTTVPTTTPSTIPTSTTNQASTSTATTTTPPPTTPTTPPSTTPAIPCQPGGTFVNQDIAVIYDLSQTGDNTTDTQLPTFISTTLFSPSSYTFEYLRPVPIPFPRTQDYAATSGIPLAFANINNLQHYKVFVNTQLSLSQFFNSSQSIVNDALAYILTTPTKRRPNIPENIIIVAKNANSINQSTIDNAQTLKNSGMTIITIGIGNQDFTYLYNLATSNDYTFTINDLNDFASITDTVNSIAAKLVNLCATNF